MEGRAIGHFGFGEIARVGSPLSEKLFPVCQVGIMMAIWEVGKSLFFP